MKKFTQYTSNPSRLLRSGIFLLTIGLLSLANEAHAQAHVGSSHYEVIANGDDALGAAARTQLYFGYSGSATNNAHTFYHGIKTRHNGGAGAGNAIDFYTFNHLTDHSGTQPSKFGMTINHGKVGIGKLNPAAFLHVWDNTTVGQRLALFDLDPSAGGATTAHGSYIEVNNPSNTQALFGTDGDATGGNVKDVFIGNWTSGGGLAFYSGGGNKNMFLDANGHFGVADAAPSAIVSVVGNIRASNEAAETNYIEIDHSGSHAFINRGGAGDLLFNMAGSTRMTLKSNGNLGIGIDPTEALDVSGNGKFSGNLTVDGIAAFGGNVHDFGSSPSATRSLLRIVANQEWAYIQAGSLPADGAPKKLRITQYATVNSELTDFEVYAANTTFSGAVTTGDLTAGEGTFTGNIGAVDATFSGATTLAATEVGSAATNAN
ncbi:MAG TPA: hypothetical protein DCE41_36740, partial [Cytophagales bacterium]|nr:hypothetical protein [Cytophagales bacterium]